MGGNSCLVICHMINIKFVVFLMNLDRVLLINIHYMINKLYLILIFNLKNQFIFEDARANKNVSE